MFSERSTASDSRRGHAALEVFCGGASYGVMATTYKLAYAAGFTSNQVMAGQAWGGFLLFALALLMGAIQGKAPKRLPAATVAKLMGTGALTGLTSVLYCYAMSRLPVPVALTLLFQFTWIGSVVQMALTRRPPAPAQVLAAAVILLGTVLASGVYRTGLLRYDPVALLCGFGAAISCALFVTLSGKVEAPCSTEQRGTIVCAGTALLSCAVAPTFLPSGALLQGMAPFALVSGLFGLLVPVLLFGLGSPHLAPGVSTILASAELPAGLLVAMAVLGTPIRPVEWIGVAVILAGVAISQTRRKPSPAPSAAQVQGNAD